MIHVVRLGEPRQRNEGLRIGTVRRVPRGVRKDDYARRDYFDVWLPALAPSDQLVSWAQSDPWDERRWMRFAREYRREMSAPDTQRLIGLLAALSQQTDLAVGCYCADATRCHRSLLRDLLVKAGAAMAEDDAQKPGAAR